MQNRKAFWFADKKNSTKKLILEISTQQHEHHILCCEYYESIFLPYKTLLIYFVRIRRFVRMEEKGSNQLGDREHWKWHLCSFGDLARSIVVFLVIKSHRVCCVGWPDPGPSFCSEMLLWWVIILTPIPGGGSHFQLCCTLGKVWLGDQKTCASVGT